MKSWSVQRFKREAVRQAEETTINRAENVLTASCYAKWTVIGAYEL
jgi:hypothetical protein